MKVTDDALGAAMGVERSVANKIVNDKVPMNAWRTNAVAELLDVDPLEVLFRIGILTDPPKDPWHPKPETVAALIRPALPALRASPSSEDTLLDVAHEISGALEQLAVYSVEDDPKTLKVLVDGIALKFGAKKHGKSASKSHKSDRTPRNHGHT